MQESKWHRPCTHKKQMPISTSAVQDFTRHLMGASSAALCSAFCFVLQGFAWSKCYDDKSHRDASRLDGLKADHCGASPWNSEWKELPWVARLNLSPPRAKVPSPLLAVPDCNNKLSASQLDSSSTAFACLSHPLAPRVSNTFSPVSRKSSEPWARARDFVVEERLLKELVQRIVKFETSQHDL